MSDLAHSSPPDLGRYRLSPNARANPASPDGRVVMHLLHGRMLMLNGVGAAIWEGLERRRPMGAVASDIASEYEIPLEVAQRDTAAFLQRLLARDLIEPDSSNGMDEAPFSTDSSPASAVPFDMSTAGDIDVPRRRTEVAIAFVGFALVDLLTSIRQFKILHRVVRAWPIRADAGADAIVAARTRAAVDRAAVWYPRRAMCLQRSTVLTCLLRRRGIPAHLVFGARTNPFYAHAWVEVGGLVFNDEPDVRSRYPPFDRC